jgi:hypothetical protein
MVAGRLKDVIDGQRGGNGINNVATRNRSPESSGTLENAGDYDNKVHLA